MGFTPPRPDYFTDPELAKEWGISRGLVIRYIETGKLKADAPDRFMLKEDFRFEERYSGYKILLDEVQRFEAEHKRPTAPPPTSPLKRDRIIKFIPPRPDYFTDHELAKEWGIDRVWVIRYIEADKLKAEKARGLLADDEFYLEKLYKGHYTIQLSEVLRFETENAPKLITLEPVTSTMTLTSPPIKKGDKVPKDKRRPVEEITEVITYTIEKHKADYDRKPENLEEFLEYLRGQIKPVTTKKSNSRLPEKDRDNFLAEKVENVGYTSDNCIMLHNPRTVKGEGKKKAWYDRGYIEKRFKVLLPK